MKTLHIFTLLSLISFSAFCQEIDENGRTTTQQKALSAVIQTPAIYFQEDIAVKSVTAFTMKFSLPEGKTAGEIIIFHPRVDQELKKISLTQRQGAVQIPTQGLPSNVVLGLYTNGVLLESKNVKIE